MTQYGTFPSLRPSQRNFAGVYPKSGDTEAQPKYGTMVKPMLYAPVHQHYFNVR
jgi:Cu2+-containing amine oxidase